MITKKIDLGEYVIRVSYDKETSSLDVEVCDELGEIIEFINIRDDDEEADS